MRHLIFVLDEDTNDDAIYVDGTLSVRAPNLYLCDVAHVAGDGPVTVEFRVTRCDGQFTEKAVDLPCEV